MLPNSMPLIVVGSGKGGVGKTALSLSLSQWLMRVTDNHVCWVDGDPGLSTLDAWLPTAGEHPSLLSSWAPHHGDVVPWSLSCECWMDLPWGTRAARLFDHHKSVHWNPAWHTALIREGLRSFMQHPVVLDAGPGLSEPVFCWTELPALPLVIVTADPASLTDAYAYIKLLHREYGFKKIGVVVNRLVKAELGPDVFRRLERVVNKFLNVELLHWGSIPEDPAWIRSTISMAHLNAPTRWALDETWNNVWQTYRSCFTSVVPVVHQTSSLLPKEAA